MSAGNIRSVVLEELGNIAPEADLPSLDPKADLREALEIDSMDFLNFITAVHHRLNVNIPEADYPKVRTLATVVAYIDAALAKKPA